MALKQTLAFVTVLLCSQLSAEEKGNFKVCGRGFSLELAKTEASRSKGLMFRKEVPVGKGMIFVFEKPELQTFWMKNVPIALDILFFDAAGKLINSMTMIPESELVQDLFLKRYASDRPSQYVVELRDGTLKTFTPAELKNCRLSPLPKI